MILSKYDYVTESVLKGHPDKVCDQISDAILDAILHMNSNAHVAIECMGCDNTIIVAGEVSIDVELNTESIVRALYSKIGYKNYFEFINLLSTQSHQLDEGVKNGGAGDQGIIYGYACESSFNYLPVGYYCASQIAQGIDEYRLKSNLFLPDGKVLVTVHNNKVSKILVSVQHSEDADLPMLRKQITENVICPIFAENMPKVEICKDTGFVCGGFENDTGLTGRKIIVDTYGGIAPHGGGAFSGKDPSKVDRSAAYMARFVAKNIVANKYAKDCLVSVAYEFGQEQPSMLAVYTDMNRDLTDLVNSKFDFRPNAIIERFSLTKIKYLPTATYGHFTNAEYPWEETICI